MFPQLRVDLQPHVMAVLGSVGTAALVAGAGAVVTVLSNGSLSFNQADVAHVLAAALGGAIAAYTQSSRA